MYNMKDTSNWWQINTITVISIRNNQMEREHYWNHLQYLIIHRQWISIFNKCKDTHINLTNLPNNNLMMYLSIHKVILSNHLIISHINKNHGMFLYINHQEGKSLILITMRKLNQKCMPGCSIRIMWTKMSSKVSEE